MFVLGKKRRNGLASFSLPSTRVRTGRFPVWQRFLKSERSDKLAQITSVCGHARARDSVQR